MKFGIYFTVPGSHDILMTASDNLSEALTTFAEAVRQYQYEVNQSRFLDTITLQVKGDMLPWAEHEGTQVMYIWPVSCNNEGISVK